jgi:hypothetical protein
MDSVDLDAAATSFVDHVADFELVEPGGPRSILVFEELLLLVAV